MCLKGGPRCHSHAQADVAKTVDKLQAQEDANKQLEKNFDIAIKNHQNYSGDDAKILQTLDSDLKKTKEAYDKGQEQATILKEKSDKLTKAAQATPGGIELLKERLDIAEREGTDVSSLSNDLALAESTYDHNLEEYDRREGTVDSRKPSPYGNYTGIETLTDRAKLNTAKVARLYKESLINGATEEGDKKIANAELEAERLKAQMAHAYRTENHRRHGIIPKEETIPFAGSKMAATDHAISSELNYSGPTPSWMKKKMAMAQERWGKDEQPRIIDTIDSPEGQLAVVWSPRSLGESEHSIQDDRGFVINETSFVNMKTGEKVAYLKSSYVNEASLQKSFGNNEWSSIAYMDEYSGSQFGIRDYQDLPKTTIIDKLGIKRKGPRYKKVNTIEEAKTPEELLAAKRRIWAGSHSALKLQPLSKEEYIPSYNIVERMAPTSHAEIDADLVPIRGIADKEYANFKKDYKTPYVDFASVNRSMKGTGLGSSLYVYSARMLGKQGQVLRGSGIQTDDAGSVWKRFVEHKELPVKKLTRNHSKAGKSEHYALDFREK